VTSNDHKTAAQPLLNGLVLAGGKSKRMGTDKGILQWHGKEQRYYMADLLQNVCNEVFISCRVEQQPEIDNEYHTLADAFTEAGPLGGILSALKAQPDKAWFVGACDLPLLDMATLKYLIEHRDVQALATTFKSPFDDLPEPLITIWEPGSYAVLLEHLSAGFTCPRKALIRNNERVSILQAPDPDKLMNANTPEDAEKVKEMIRKSISSKDEQ
jgi:molybdenum cofactor guanylyltransferase